jgi:predicted CoA-binding protein
VTHLGGIATHKNPDDKKIKRLLEGSRNVAVVGLSEKQYRTSHQIARTLQRFGYKIFPVNPNLTGPVLGEEPYATVEEIPKRIDIVDVFRRSEKVMPTAKDAVAAGAKALWMQSGVVNEEAAAYARENGLTVVMDRCIMVDYTSLVGR